MPLPKLSSGAQGALLLAVAVLLFWIGNYFRVPMEAEGRLLVATDSVRGDIFENAVVLMLKHRRSGAYGLVINKPGVVPEAGGEPTAATGGPVDPEKISVLCRDCADIGGAAPVFNTGLYYAEGAAAATEARTRAGWHLVLKGYSGWGLRQLDREIRQGHWKVVDFDTALVTATPPGDMWKAAGNHAPALPPLGLR